MPDTDPMAEALTSLGARPPNVPRPRATVGSFQPYRTKKGAIKFQPESDWSLDRLPEIESRYKQTHGRGLPVKVRGQGAIHDRWGYDHHDSADISLNPTSSEGQALMAQLQEKNVPFLAFDKAIPGVATGPHIHVGRASHRKGQQRPSYDTQLNLGEEQNFQEWKREYAPSDSGADYDLRGAFKAGLKPDASGHWPDTFKKPNHPTFSNESRHAKGANASRAGSWQGEQFTPATQSAGDPMAEALSSLGAQTDTMEDQRPVNRPLTGNDVAWHLGADPSELRNWRPKVRERALEIVSEAVAEDERKRAEGQEIGPPNLQYHNEMRRRAGLEPITQEVNLSGRAELARNLGPLRTGPQPKVITAQDEDRDRIRGEVIAERAARQQGPMTQARAALAMADQGQRAQAIEEEVSRRLTAQREAQAQHEQTVSQFTDNDRAEIQDFVKAVKGSGEKTQGLRLAARSVGSDLLFKLAGLSEVPTLGQGKNYLGDWLRRKATAGELSVEDVRRELNPSQQRDLAEFISSLPLGVAGVAPFVMAGGPVGGFAASGFTGAVGRRKPASEVLKETAREATIGAVFKGAGRLERPARTLLGRAGQLAKSGAAIGTGTFAVEKGFGSTNEEALRAAGTNVLLHGAMGTPRVLRSGTLPTKAQAPEMIEPTEQRFYHRDWGEVIRAVDQTGARPGQTKVYEATNTEQFHYPKTADLNGSGNQRMVPVRPSGAEAQATDPMAEALTTLGAKIYRSQEPDAGPAQFRGLDDSALYDLAVERSIPKGTSRGRRQQIAEEQAGARAELERRQTETPIEIVPPDTGLRANESNVPSFQEYVENRPEGGIRFETLEPGSPDFNRLANEYTARYGTRPGTTQPQATQPTQPIQGAIQGELGRLAVPERPETLQAQMDQLNQAKRPAVLFTAGETILPHQKGLVETKTQAGTWVHNPTIPPERTAEQAAAFAKQYPGAKISTGGSELAEDVITERLAHPAAREGEIVKPWEMSRKQIEEEFQRKKAEDDNLEAAILGPELAKKYARLQRAANSTYDTEKADRASAEIEKIEASLSETDRNRLYGIGETGPQLDDFRNYRQSLGNLDDSNPQSLAESMRWAVSRVGNETDPLKMNHDQQVAYGTLREAARIAHENGWDTQAISREAVKAAGQRFSDPEDAAFMLDRFIKKETAPTRVAPKQIAAQPKPPEPTPPLPARTSRFGDLGPKLVVTDPMAETLTTLQGVPVKKELPPVEAVSVGRESKAVTERGSEIGTRYAIVDLDNLVTSHDSALRVNPDFPSELQPRERDRAASADQISRIATQLRPDFLGESPKASEGAPIVGHDGIVESGNGRVLALGKAYESKNRGSRDYKQFLIDNAERLGLDPAAISERERPVLVRIRTSDVDREKFVKEANEQSIASMSPVEQARSDAKMLKGGLLDLFRPSESGDINTAANMNFVRAFMKSVVGPNEVGRYTTASGQLSQEGVARIRNGIFARAYGDSAEGLIALEKLAESPDNNVRNITTAMLRNAPGLASLREGIDQGTRYPLDLASDISAAMSKMSSLRENGMLVPDYLRQGSLYGEDLTPIQKRLLQVFDENKRGANTIDTILKNYLRGAEAAGSPTQGGLFGAETPSKADFLEAAILEAIDAHKNVSPGLFAAPDQGLQSQPPPRGANPEVNARVSTVAAAAPESPASFAPKLSESEGAAAETAGHPLKRFDSTIDRLKLQEEEARQRLTERGTEYQKLLDQKGSALGATTIPQDLYDYVVIGASKLAQRSLNVAQFVDEMVREFGDAIRKHARTIFKHSQKMVMDTQKEIRAERLSKEIANRLFTENVPIDQQREALRIAAKFRTSTDTQGKFLSGFKSRVGEMARSYGAAGGELTNRLHLGDIARAHEMEAGNKYLSKIQDVYNGTKNDFERMRVSESVIKALENRAEAERYLDTPEKKAVYQNTVEMLDTFRAKLKALGYETRDDYFTHIRDVDILDQIISDAKDPKENGLNDLVAARSRFLQTRVDAKMEIKKNLPQVLFAYLKSVTKEIAYNDAVEYYYDHFVDDIPISLRKNSMDRAIKLMQNSLQPEQGRGRFFRTVGRLRSEQYRNFLAYNLKASAQNFTQADFARMRWTKEATSITNSLWRSRKTITGPLADAIDLASSKQTPLMRFLEQFKGDEPTGSQNRFVVAFNKYDPFQRSEGRNWGMSELGSIVNSVVKRPEYQELKTSKGSVDAINELLKKQNIFDAAVREAATTAAETQVAANPAMRGEFYDAPLHRIVGMFTAFKTRQLQTLGEALRSHEGINGARAQTILRRGLSGDAQPVEVLREIEAQRTAMEMMIRRARKFNENIGIPRSDLAAMVQHLKNQEIELNGIIGRLEPLSGSRARSVMLVAKYFAKVSAISVFFNLFWDSVYSAIAGPEEDKDEEERVSTALKRAFWDVLPSPFYGANPSKFFVSPVAPNFERSAPYGNITKRGLARDVASYGTSVIPFAGVIDRATNRKLSGAVVDVVAPKKEKEKKIEF